jgi:putative PIN family toxin of toxin-antitoxin system
VKVLLDTNVMVSALATRGLCSELFQMVLTEHELLVAEVVLTELERVLTAKFHMPPHAVSQTLGYLRKQQLVPRPHALAGPEVRDTDDAWVLASALAGGADVLVTGDKDLLSIADQVSDVVIIDPRGFWALHRPK